jgi:ribosomal-protein-alanine N-acetyltransferase
LVLTVIFKLRSHTPEDLESLYQIDQLCYEPEIAYSRPEIKAYLRFPGAECVISETGRGKIAGFCLAAYEKPLGYVITMDVAPRYRRQGVAQALLEEIEQRLAVQNVREVWLETATDNEPAIAFWQKHGYRKGGVRKGYYPGGRDAYTMRKALGSPSRGATVARET